MIWTRNIKLSSTSYIKLASKMKYQISLRERNLIGLGLRVCACVTRVRTCPGELRHLITTNTTFMTTFIVEAKSYEY